MTAKGAHIELATERQRLRRDTFANYAGLIVPGTCEILLVPMLLRGLGREQYGVWLILVAIVAIGASLEVGLASIVTREVAREERKSQRDVLLSAALAAFLGLGLTGAAVIATSPLAAKRFMGVQAGRASDLGIAFPAVGIGFLFDRIRGFSNAALKGARRFDLVNGLSVGASLLWAIGAVVLLVGGFKLPALGIWWAASSALMAAAALAVLGRGQILPFPTLRLGSLREHLSFALGSQLMIAVSTLTWEVPALLIGALLGSSQIVVYHVAREFPSVIYEIGWCAATILFPESARHARSDKQMKAEAALDFATRWIVLTTLPLTLILYAVAPTLLRVWIGDLDLETFTLFQILCVATFLDIISAGALNTLWGAGRVISIVKVGAAQTLVTLGACLILLPMLGVSGVGWALLLPIPMCSAMFLALSTPGSLTRARSLVAGAFRGLVLPAVACAATALALESAVGGASVTSLIGISTVSALVYSVLVAVQPGNESERNLLIPIYGWCASAIRR